MVSIWIGISSTPTKSPYISNKLKADRLHLHDYPQTPNDYRHVHTDNNLRLVMMVVALCCTRQSRAPNIDRCAPEIWPWPVTLILTFDLDPDLWHYPKAMWCKKTIFGLWPWPTTMTYNSNLAKVKVDLHTGCRKYPLYGLNVSWLLSVNRTPCINGQGDFTDAFDSTPFIILNLILNQL